MKTLIKDPVILEVIDPNCSPRRLNDLMYDSFWLVRALVGMHQRVEIPCLIHLAYDKDVSVLSGVAANSKTPIDIAVSLSGHESEVVRCGAAMNPNIDDVILRRLENDKSDMVKDAAKRNRKKRGE